MVRCYQKRKTEHEAGGALAPLVLWECEAVSRAIESTLLLPNGELQLELIRLMYWQGKKLRIADVAPLLHIAEITGNRWHGAFIRRVAREVGYMSTQEG